MNGRYAPLSPVSQNGGGEWSGTPRYQAMDGGGGGHYGGGGGGNYHNNNHNNGGGGGGNPAARGQFISPPNSGGSDGRMNMSPFSRTPNGGGGDRGGGGGPSPPPSVARSSTGTNVYARSDSGHSTSAPPIDPATFEATLGQHYLLFQAFLRENNIDPRTAQPLSVDRLLRFPSETLLELSTDVFDELTRRKAKERRDRMGSGEHVPDCLPPLSVYRTKHNEMRRKLATMVPERFHDLALDLFRDLERRFPNFVAGDIPRAPSRASGRSSSRSQTPSSGGGGGMRSASRMRKPSDASSLRGPPMVDPYGMPASPRMPPSEFGGSNMTTTTNGGVGPRPTYKPFQNNMIIPNKSTMVEEGDDDDDGDAAASVADESFSARGRGRSRAESAHGRNGSMGRPNRSMTGSDADKKIIDDYQTQVRELRAKVSGLEESLRKRDDEITEILDGERSRETAANLEKKEWADLRLRLESRVADAEALSESLRDDLARARDEHASEVRTLRMELDSSSGGGANAAAADAELRRENDELREELRQQQDVTDEVRREAAEFLREMRQLSQQSGSSFNRQAELEQTVEQLEAEVRDWKGRYAKAKTQLRSMRASSSMGLPLEHDASRLVRERGFADAAGLVRDVHVTRFQISVDELLHKARTADPDKVVDAMKVVVGNVRRITKDLDQHKSSSDGDGGADEARRQELAQAKSKVAGTANRFITAAKDFAAAAGLSPVALLDAATGHLVAAMVDMLRVAKIRPSPAGELEDDYGGDDDGTVTPTGSAGFFSSASSSLSQRTTRDDEMAPPALKTRQQHTQQAQAQHQAYQPASQQQQQPQAYTPMAYTPARFQHGDDDGDDAVLPPPPFQGLGGIRDSGVSSAYSPVSSPRQSSAPNGATFRGSPPRQPLPTSAASRYGARHAHPDDLKLYLDDQTAMVVSSTQSLVGSIRADADARKLAAEIDAILTVVGRIVNEVDQSGHAHLLDRVADCRERLVAAGARGNALAARGVGPTQNEWRMWTGGLPPIAFEIAREAKALVGRIEEIMGPDDEFA